jgi:hypothetical protein
MTVATMALAAPRRRRRLPRLTDRLKLGSKGLAVSPVCLGTVGAAEVIPAAYDAGINFFFISADLHWPHYEQTRRGLQMLLRRPGVRQDVVIAVATYMAQRRLSWASLHEVLMAVPEMETIDVAVVGGSYGADFLDRYGEFRARGVAESHGVRACAATFHDRRAALYAINHDLVDLGLFRYNPAHSRAREDTLPLLRRRTPAKRFGFNSVHGYVTRERFTALGLGSEYWHPKVTDHFRFALTRPELDGILTALHTPAHVTALVEALESGPLDATEENYLINLAHLAEGRASLAKE